MKIGIYLFHNLVNDKRYIGQSTDIDSRRMEHISKLHSGKHRNKHLLTSWNKYGESAFEFSVLEYCDERKLNDREEYWINLYNTTNKAFGYNKRPGGNNSRMAEASRKKLSQARKGIVFSEEHCENLSKAAKNRKYNTGKPSIKRTLPKGNGKHIDEKIALEIIKAINEGTKSMKEIAEDFEVSFYTVAHIKGSRSWKHLPRPWLTKSSSI